MRVRGYDLHGHDLAVEVCIDGEVLRDGMVMDIEELRKIVSEVLTPLDRRYLNEVLGIENATIEILATYVHDQLRLRGLNPSIVRIRIDGYAYVEYVPQRL